MSQEPKTDSEQGASSGLTYEEVFAELRLMTAGIARIHREHEHHRKRWPEDIFVLAKIYHGCLSKLLEGKDKLDAECFMAVHEATSVFLSFLEEERRYVEAGAPGQGGK